MYSQKSQIYSEGQDFTGQRTEYVANSQPELSQVLQSRITDGEREKITYYFYGKGLLSQENVTGGYLTYHFNNVGSTMAVTDQEGKVKYSYNYTPYGELLDGEYSDTVPFLYNGQFGVTTDGNGLYYMRARYYNVDIKRFVNQDVLTGTLERISSLNRYAYVEGNPVSFLDPFGLEKSIYDEWHEFLVLLEKMNAISSFIGDFLSKIPGVGEGIGVVSILTYCTDIGVGIGRAWEGVFENDFAKIDSSYIMVKDAFTGLVMTIGNMALADWMQDAIFGIISDLSDAMNSMYEFLEEKKWE